MEQERLFYEDELDALKDAVRALGGGKIVGPMLWPEKKPDIGARCLADALNSDRKERLTLAQVMLIMRRAHEKGFHGPWRWISGEVGYSAEPIEPEDELTRLLRDYVSDKARSSARDDKIERMMAELLKGSAGRLRAA